MTPQVRYTLAALVFILALSGAYFLGKNSNVASPSHVTHQHEKNKIDEINKKDKISDALDTYNTKNTSTLKADSTQITPVASVQKPEGSLHTSGHSTHASPISPLVSELESLTLNARVADFQALGEKKKELLRIVKTNNEALDELINTYTHSNNNALQDALFQVLSQVKNPKIEHFATELVNSNERENTITGFNLLATLKNPTKQTFTLSKTTLQEHSDDKGLVLSALHALPKVMLSAQENHEVISLLSELTQNSDEAVRSESLLSIGSWAKTEEELQSVVNALDSQTIDDRISAAMALEKSSVIGESLKQTLLNTIGNENALWEVKAMSANALERFNLNDNEFATLQHFRTIQVGGVKH